MAEQNYSYAKNSPSVQRLTRMALMAALISASSYISIPLPFSGASLTAQTIMINLTGLIMAPFEAAAVIIIWILIGLTGVPVFSGGTGGPAKLFGPSGGYIWGFLVAAFLIALFCKKVGSLKLQIVFLMIVGIPVIYFFGAVWMKYITGQSWGLVLVQAVLPFIPLDIVKCFVAAGLAKIVRKAGF
jgi:biotin transport system substrate-specific component